MGHFERIHRLRAHSSTDERWLLLALGPGVLGGCLLRLLFRDAFWIVTGWTIGWLLVASAGTIWSWIHDRTAHLAFLALYASAAIVVTVLAVMAWL